MNDLEYLERMLQELENKEKEYVSFRKGNEFATIFMRNCFPYKIEYDNNQAMFVNREYKPLFVFGYSGFISYKDFKERLFDLDNETYLFMKENYFFKNKDVLFNDDTAPWLSKKNYQKYLKKLKQIIYYIKHKKHLEIYDFL